MSLSVAMLLVAAVVRGEKSDDEVAAPSGQCSGGSERRDVRLTAVSGPAGMSYHSGWELTDGLSVDSGTPLDLVG